MRGKLLVLQETQNGCIVPLSHKLNRDGYFRCRYPNYKGKGRAPLVMYHRYVWEQENGAIPDGYETDHLCHNRACCNIQHLQCIKGEEHTRKHNKTRNLERKQKAKEYWLAHQKVTGVALASLFCVSFSIACRWIREWKVQRLSVKE